MMDGLASLFHNHPRNSVLRCGGVLDPLLPRGLFPLGEDQDALAEARHRRLPADVVHRDRDLPGVHCGSRPSYASSRALRAASQSKILSCDGSCAGGDICDPVDGTCVPW